MYPPPMPHLYEKKFRGRTYWYLREVHRVNGKVRLKWQKYLGTAETILAKIEDAERAGRPVRLKPNPSAPSSLRIAWSVSLTPSA